MPNLCGTKTARGGFEELKAYLTTAPIVGAPNWQLPFEVMCDASDLAIGAVLGHREEGKPYVVYYASKTLNKGRGITLPPRKSYWQQSMLWISFVLTWLGWIL